MSRACVFSNTTLRNGTEDHNGLNAGVCLFKVDRKSLIILEELLSYSAKSSKFRWAEQSALSLVATERALEAKREMAIIPNHWINFYYGENAYTGEKPVIVMHFPSLGWKRKVLLPLLKRIREKKVKMDPGKAKEYRQKMQEEASAFWKAFSSKAP